MRENLKTVWFGFILLILSSTAFAVSPFSLSDMNSGTMYKSSDYVNNVFVLDFYQYNCGYCHENVPNMHNIAEEFKEHARVQILDVGIDTRDDLYRQWIARHKPTYPVLKDSSRSLAREIGLRGTPTTVVLDCNLEVVHRVVGRMSVAQREELKRVVYRESIKVCSIF
jgi:peroxiredoxin